MGNSGNRSHLDRRIDRAAFGDIGQRNRPTLDGMDKPMRGFSDGHGQRVGGELAIRPVQQGQLGTARVELRRAAFVHLGMGLAVAIDRLPGLGVGGQ